MPNHIHIIWQMCNGYKKENVQREFLKFVSQNIKYDLIKNHPNVLEVFKVDQLSRKYQFWQNRPLSVELYNQSVFDQKLDYIHNNPIQEKWKLCEFPEDYIYSSASFYLIEDKRWSFLSYS